MNKLGNQFTIQIDYNVDWKNYDAIMEACRNLNGAAFKLFVYLSSFDKGEEFYFFPKLFCDTCNVSLTSEKNAFNELLIKQYLKQIQSDYFLFSFHKN